jgi:Ca-activated chloride channel homolog
VRGGIVKKFDIRALIARGLACVLFSLPGFVVSRGQEVSESGAGVYRSNATIRVHSDLVLIPVTVTDGSGKVVSGLEKEHFTLFEDDAQQEITHFAAEDAPASIGIVFDASDSMQPKIRKAREAVHALLDNANPGDEFFLVRFSTDARVVVPMTSQIQEVRDQVATLRVTGATALIDGVRLAMAEMKHAHYSRKAIIIISDGEDNCSRWTVGDLKSAVREQDILIYAIGLIDSSDYIAPWPQQQLGSALLRDIAGQTGGRLFEVSRLKQLPDIAAKISGWLRNQYVLGYVPNHSEKDGTYRKIQLKIARPRGYPRLHAVWRQGYYAPKE